MSKPLRGIMFDNTSGDLSNNLGLGDAALTHLTSGADNIAVGYNALQTTTTGSSNVAIGNQAASDSNYSNTITINATGNSLDTTNDSGCFVAPIRNASATNALYYDNATKEITWDASGGGGGGIGNLVSGNLLVTGTAEAKGDLLTPIHSAEGSSQSVITDLVPSTNPLMTKGMLWMNEAQDASSAWNYVAPMDVSRAYMGCATLGGKLYAVGGGTGVGGGVPVNSLQVYDPINNSWNMLAPMDASRSSHGVAALGGKLYAVGGNSAGLNALDTSECYDPRTNSWSYIEQMATTRTSCGVAALGGKLYIAGGAGHSLVARSSVGVYDPTTNSWTNLAIMSTARFAPGLAALGGKLYAVGGSLNNGTLPLASAEVYDPVENSWTSCESLVTGRYGLGVEALGGKLYAVGGFEGLGGNVVDSVEVYDPINPSGGWEIINNLITARGWMDAAAVGGKLYAVGGYNSFMPPDGFLNTVEVYDPSLVTMPQITYQGEDFYISHSRGGPKTFVIPHPEHEGKMLRHACLEAPTRGTNVYEYQITTTEDNQTTTISLPSYFKHINGRPRVYVRPTNVLSRCCGNVNNDLTAALITTEKPGTFNVMVTGVRKDPDAVAYSATEHIDEPIAADDIPSSGTNA